MEDRGENGYLVFINQQTLCVWKYIDQKLCIGVRVKWTKQKTTNNVILSNFQNV